MAYDKKLHFIAGLCISVAAMLLYFYCYGTVNVLFGVGGGMVAGVAKEVKDEITYGGFDELDMYATWAGSLLGAGLIYILLQGGVLNGF